MFLTEEHLFLFNALIEGVFGLIVLINPNFMFTSNAINIPTTLTAARMAASAMIALGVTSYEGYKSSGSRRAIGKGMLVYHVAILALGAYSFFISGGYLPGPEVAGVPLAMKFGSFALTHGFLAVEFFQFVTRRKLFK